MAHNINGIRLYVSYWGLNDKLEIKNGSRAITKIFDGISCADVMNQYNNFSYTHDLSKYTPTQIVYVEEL